MNTDMITFICVRIQFENTNKLGIDRLPQYDKNVFTINGTLSYLYPQYPDVHKSSCRHVNNCVAKTLNIQLLLWRNTSFLLPGYSWALGPFSFDYSLHSVVVFGGVANCILYSAQTRAEAALGLQRREGKPEGRIIPSNPSWRLLGMFIQDFPLNEIGNYTCQVQCFHNSVSLKSTQPFLLRDK